MLDKDKLWIVFHIGIGGIDEQEVPEYIDGIYEKWKYDESVNLIIIPERDKNRQFVEILQTPCVLFPQINKTPEIRNTLND